MDIDNEFSEELINYVYGKLIEVVKSRVSEYKENIKKLDDDLFISVVEELETKLDLKEFNDLLELEEYDEDSLKVLLIYLELSSNIIKEKIEEKVNDLEELSQRF